MNREQLITPVIGFFKGKLALSTPKMITQSIAKTGLSRNIRIHSSPKKNKRQTTLPRSKDASKNRLIMVDGNKDSLSGENA